MEDFIFEACYLMLVVSFVFVILKAVKDEKGDWDSED